MKEYQIICIDDDEQFISSLENSLPEKIERLCKQFMCVFDFVTTPDEAFEVLSSCGEDGISPAMIVSDQVMPKMNGIELIEKIKTEYPDMVCVLLTGHAGLDSAKHAINHHLLDQYATKPIEDIQEFASLMANLLKRYHMDMEERERTIQLAETVEKLRISNEEIKAMHTAAEQVAMLSKSLKSLDYSEVVQIVSSDVPKIFHAKRGVLCFPDDGCQAEQIYRLNCSCSDEKLRMREDVERAHENSQILCCDDISCPCDIIDGQSPDIVIPLAFSDIYQDDNKQSKKNRGYLCLCQVDSDIKASSKLIKYKGGLVKDIMSVNLTNAKLYQQARHDSQTDLLTGLSTRRVLEEKLETEYDRAVRYKHQFCVSMLDVDHFKEINDSFGHAEGDQTLRELAEILRNEKRSADILARQGGDEFVILMPETDLDSAHAAIKRVRAKVEATLTTQGQSVTISCGVANWSGNPSETGAGVLRRADAALYLAKREGRNRVATAKADAKIAC